MPFQKLAPSAANSLPAAPPKIPRLVSLAHRLQQARDAEGQPLPLLDELLFLLENPPSGVTDRWQAGADLCAGHGIATSRMSVWRFYRGHILQWRSEQNPPPVPDPQAAARTLEQARHLATERALEMLNDPNLSPGHLISILQHLGQGRKLQLARDEFEDRVTLRRDMAQRARYQRIDEEARRQAVRSVHLESTQKIAGAVPPGPASSRQVTEHPASPAPAGPHASSPRPTERSSAPLMNPQRRKLATDYQGNA